MTTKTAHELLIVHPDTLEIGDNVRDEVDLAETPEFVESITEHGVLHPVLAERREDGTVVVVDGQRRTLAAQAARLSTMPVFIQPAETGNDNARKAVRIGQQIISNDQRAALTDGQRAAGIAAMLELGLSTTAVAKATSVPRNKVKPLATIGASKAARSSLDTHQLTLDQASIVAEFEAAGDIDGIERLLRAPYDFHYLAERLRQDREERHARAQVAAPFQAKGFTILTGYRYNPITDQDVLTDAGEPITIDIVEADPARWGVELNWREGWFDQATGDEVFENQIDWNTAENPELAAEEGLRHSNDIDTRRVWDHEFHLLDPTDLEGSGLRLTDVAQVALARRSGRTAAVPATAEEAAAQLEKDREERRRVRELNKRADAATTVRRNYLRTLLARTKPPTGAAAWIAATLATDPHMLAEYHATDCLADLLGVKALTVGNAVHEMAIGASDSRAQVITLALVVAGMEARMVKDAWRTRPRGAVSYLEFLASNGHDLTDVEKAIAGHIQPESIDLD